MKTARVLGFYRTKTGIGSPTKEYGNEKTSVLYPDLVKFKKILRKNRDEKFQFSV